MANGSTLNNEGLLADDPMKGQPRQDAETTAHGIFGDKYAAMVSWVYACVFNLLMTSKAFRDYVSAIADKSAEAKMQAFAQSQEFKDAVAQASDASVDRAVQTLRNAGVLKSP